VLFVPFFAIAIEASDALGTVLLVDPAHAEEVAGGLYGILLVVNARDHDEVNAEVPGHVLNSLAARQ